MFSSVGPKETALEDGVTVSCARERQMTGFSTSQKCCCENRLRVT